MQILRTLFILSILTWLLTSCAGSSNDPVLPDSLPDSSSDVELTSNHHPQGTTNNTSLWGLWDISYDPDTGGLDAVPMRTAMFTVNVNQFVDGYPINLFFEIHNIDNQTEFTDISVDVGLQHPFPGMDQYTGFDVLGVFMGNGSGLYPGSYGLTVAGPDDQQLMNADGYTRWFNRPEFNNPSMELLGYDPGKAGTFGYNPTAELNTYRYFCDGLDKQASAFDYLSDHPEDRGSFAAGSLNWRRYEIHFPNPLGIKFQYAVIAHWEVNLSHPNPPPDLDDFPPEANVDHPNIPTWSGNSTI